jgi:DNA-directed RNA polymerase specialized sigma subunit
VSTELDIKTHQLVTEYQQLLLLEKEALLACPTAKEAMIDLLLDLQKPTRQRRINAHQLAKLVTGLNRGILSPHQLLTELLEVPISLENWNAVRRSAEHELGATYDIWRALLDDVSQIRNKVLLDYMYLVKNMAYSFSPGDPLLREDFESYAVIGMIRALDSFKTNLSIPFVVHAYHWMLSYLSRMADRLGTVTPSEPARRVLSKYRECRNNFSAKHSRTPTLQEMVEQLDMPLEKLVPIIQMGRPIASLDAVISKTTFEPSYDLRSDDERATLHDVVSDTAGVTPGNDLEDLKKAIGQALSRLNASERVAVAFYLEMNLNDVTAETTYPLAAALDLLKDWARERLRSWVPGEFVSTEDLP